jgi:DNA topoisomerase-2
VLQRVSKTKVRVTELPVGRWTDDAKDAFAEFVEAEEDVRCVDNNSSEVEVSFTFTFAREEALNRWLQTDEARPPLSRLEVALRLVSTTGMSSGNMHLFTPQGRIHKYAGPEAVLEDFFAARLDGYARRRLCQLARLRDESGVLDNRIRFLRMVDQRRLQLSTCRSEEEQDELLEGAGLDRVNGSYEYLTSTPVGAMNGARLADLERKLEAARQKTASLEGATPQGMWAADLDRFEASYRRLQARLRIGDSVPKSLRIGDSVPKSLRIGDSVPKSLRIGDSVPKSLAHQHGHRNEGGGGGEDGDEDEEPPSDEAAAEEHEEYTPSHPIRC